MYSTNVLVWRRRMANEGRKGERQESFVEVVGQSCENTVKEHQDAQKDSEGRTCGARERKK